MNNLNNLFKEKVKIGKYYYNYISIPLLDKSTQLIIYCFNLDTQKPTKSFIYRDLNDFFIKNEQQKTDYIKEIKKELNIKILQEQKNKKEKNV